MSLSENSFECGEARVSSSQPEHTGFGFILHLPSEVCKNVSIKKLKALFVAGMKAEEKQPVFLRTEQKFVRMSFHYGDNRTAQQAFDLFCAHSSLVFKNWI